MSALLKIKLNSNLDNILSLSFKSVNGKIENIKINNNIVILIKIEVTSNPKVKSICHFVPYCSPSLLVGRTLI